MDIPDGVLDEAMERAIREDAILRLFDARKIPGGQAARLLGVGRMEFARLLKQRGISQHDYSFDDWRDDSATIEKLWPEIESNLRRQGAGDLE